MMENFPTHQTLTEPQLSMLKLLLSRSQESLKTLLKNFFEKGDKPVTCTSTYLYREGDIPVLIVSHLDTVFRQKPQDHEIYYDREYNVMWSPLGAGFDDRAGIFMTLLLHQAGYMPYLLYCCDEEVGGTGAIKASSDLKDQVTGKFKYIIELDRRGADHCVFYRNDNKAFKEYVEDFGFVTQAGTFTDISYLAPDWNMSAVNLSVGYDNEHTYGEMLYVDWFFDTFNKVQNMLNAIAEAPYFNYVAASMTTGTLKYSNTAHHQTIVPKMYDYPYEDWYDDDYYGYSPAVGTRVCDLCDTPLDNVHTHYINSEEYGSLIVCDRCKKILESDNIK